MNFNNIFLLLQGLFRNYGDTFLESFKPHIEKLTADSSHDKHDSHQRCGMEMLCGILRGAKHWPYDMVKIVTALLSYRHFFTKRI